MKSFKDHKPYNQIRTDHLLGINVQPDNTCPLIDALMYSGSNRSKIYRVEIDNEPDHLTLDPSALINRIQELESWVHDVIDLYHEIIDKITDPDEQEELSGYYEEVSFRLKNNKDYEIRDFTNKINDIISDWQEYYADYNRANNELDSANHALIEAENNYSSFDFEEDDNDSEAQELIDDAKYNLNAIEVEIAKIKSNFDFDVENKFENITANFSELLESVRKNNDNMRSNCDYLKKGILGYLKDDYKLTQPIEYLRSLETGSPTEISLGLLDTRYYMHALSKMTNFLKTEKVLTDVQATLINKVKDINCLTDILQSAGYTTIRYYDDYDTYIKHPELYTEVNAKVENKLNRKNNLTI